ncbi:MAG: LytR C-terminal domain-containing protein [Ilumatobacteraceae bacterium]
MLAVVAVVAGFLILRAITDDDDSGSSITPDSTTAQGGSTPDISLTPGVTDPTGTVTTTTVNKQAATVVVANASGIGGSAGAMSQALQGAGYVTGEPTNTNAEQLTVSVVYYAADPAAQAVAAAVAADMGGLTTAAMPVPPPISGDLGTATVLVMLGTDTANKTLADLQAASAGAVAPPAVAGGVTTTTLAG